MTFDLLAHRGYAARFPENTIAALRGAVAAGAKRVEFDIQMTRDGVPVLLHDESLHRTCGVDRLIHEVDAAELSELSASESARLGDAFLDEPVPRLSDAVDFLVANPDVMAFVELKSESIDRIGEAAMLAAVMPCLAPIEDRMAVISFHTGVLRTLQGLWNGPLGWCIENYDATSRATATALAPAYLLTHYRSLPDETTPLWSGPWQWAIYEVVDVAIARRLVTQGAHIIETMDFRVFEGT